MRDLMPRSRSRSALADAAVLLAGVVPLLLTAHVPLVDLPNHLARQYVLRDLPTSAALQQFYWVRWGFVPNLALDLFVLAARQVTGDLDLAVRVFCILALAALFLGTRLVNRALAPDSRLYRFAPFLFYGGPFQYGFVNYCFGVGLALLLFGCWLRLRERPLGVTLPLFGAGALLLVLCHLGALAIYALAVGGYELSRGWHAEGGRRWPAILRCELRAAAHIVPVILLWALFTEPMSKGDGTRWSSLVQKLTAVLSVTAFSFPHLEIALLAVAVAAVLAALALRVVRVHPDMLPVLVLLGLLFLALPRAPPGLGYVDWRIPWGASFFALAALVPGARRAAWAGKPLAALGGALVAARIAAIAVQWVAWEPVIAEIDRTLSRLPEGAAMELAIGEPPRLRENRTPGLDHVAAYLIARRHGFEPSVFAEEPGQLLRLTPPYAPLWHFEKYDKIDALAPEYRYLLVIHPRFVRLSPSLPLRRIAAGPAFALYEVLR
jgi:hypothetical protein